MDFRMNYKCKHYKKVSEALFDARKMPDFVRAINECDDGWGEDYTKLTDSRILWYCLCKKRGVGNMSAQCLLKATLLTNKDFRRGLGCFASIQQDIGLLKYLFYKSLKSGK